MNVIMASVSVQLLLYGVMWLVLGLGYRLKRTVALQWAAAWLLGAAATALVFMNTVEPLLGRDLAVNLLVVSAFLLLRQGIDNFTGGTRWKWDFVVVLGGLLVIEALRSQGNASTTLRVCIFTLVAGWPLAGMAWRMGVWLRTTMRSSRLRIALMLLPVALTLGLFLVRAILVVVGTDATTVNFDQGSQFDLIAGMLFLVVLGFFNFSIAGLVIGSLVERLRTLSATDQLTGMANRRVMMRRLVEEHARFLRSSHVYSVVMMDLDHFKRVNDTHGHAVGDQVLKGLSTLLQNGQRQTDTLARMGGEEFMLLMPMTDLDGALAHAKRLCEKVANAALATSAGVQHITLSLGVAEAGLDDVSADIVVSRADAALYRAKAGGRNRVESAARVVMPGWVL